MDALENGQGLIAIVTRLGQISGRQAQAIERLALQYAVTDLARNGQRLREHFAAGFPVANGNGTQAYAAQAVGFSPAKADLARHRERSLRGLVSGADIAALGLREGVINQGLDFQPAVGQLARQGHGALGQRMGLREAALEAGGEDLLDQGPRHARLVVRGLSQALHLDQVGHLGADVGEVAIGFGAAGKEIEKQRMKDPHLRWGGREG